MVSERLRATCVPAEINFFLSSNLMNIKENEIMFSCSSIFEEDM
jgi:hypothetical protein